ncbi:MAG: hemolysin family protein [Breznakibacter sp.]
MELIILGALILLNGFFALSEIALVSSKRSRLENHKIKGSKGARIALRLLDDSESFLSAIQVGITLIGIVTGLYGGMAIADDFAPFFREFELTKPYAQQIALSLTVLIITYVSIVIGELVPKTVALTNPDKIAVFVAPAIYYFSLTFYPFVKLLSISTNFINRLIGIKKQAEHLTEAELRQIIKLASAEGVIEKEQNLIHEKIFYFSDKKAKHLMTHRTDVEWIDLEEPAGDIEKQLHEVQHSKVVCCRGDLDEFQGVIFLKDYYRAKAFNKDLDFQKLMVQPIIIPENADAQKVLDLLRQKKGQICIVVNEYGGFEGIITLHDILENIIGELPDEDEINEPDVFVRDDESMLVSGDAPIETLVEIVDGFTIDFGEIDYSTVAGFVFNQLGKIPRIGDRFVYLGYRFEVVDVDGNRIDKLLISKL